MQQGKAVSSLVPMAWLPFLCLVVAGWLFKPYTDPRLTISALLHFFSSSCFISVLLLLAGSCHENPDLTPCKIKQIVRQQNWNCATDLKLEATWANLCKSPISSFDKCWKMENIKSQDVWVGRDLKDHPVHPLAMGTTPSTHPAWPWILPGVGWGTLSSSRQPGPHHPHHERFSPYMQSKSALSQFRTISLCPVTTGPGKKSLPIFLISPLYILKGCSKVSPEPHLFFPHSSA